MSAVPDATPALAQARRWYAQRISAMVLAALLLVHLGVMVYAVRGGLSAAEILARTRGNWLVAAYYASMVAACAVHVPTGLANIASEWWGASPTRARAGANAFAVLLLVLGWRAVYAVCWGAP